MIKIEKFLLGVGVLMTKWFNRKYIMWMIVLILVWLPLGGTVQAEGNKEESYRILFISSYAYSWGAIPHKVNGLKDSMDSNNYKISYEFMDTKNTNYSDSYEEFYNMLKFKMNQHQPYDGVIIGDDDALQFILMYRDELFLDIPIVFEGVEQIEAGISMAKDPLITGVIERVDYATNLELAASLFPKATKLVLIYDNLESGIGIANQLEELSGLFKEYEVEHVNTSTYTKEELSKKMGTYEEDSIIFGISMGE